MTRKAKVVSGQATPKPVSQRAYAKHRGCTLSSVQKAIRDGRLEHSLATNARGHKKIANIEIADREWAANTRAKSDAPTIGDFATDDQGGADDPMTFNQARRLREIETWKLSRVKRQAEELELAARRCDLIPVDEAKATIIDEYTSVRTKLLGVPTRVRQQLQHLTTADVRVIDDFIREALEALATED